MQMLAGNPRYPKNDGIPPCARIYRSAIVFNCEEQYKIRNERVGAVKKAEGLNHLAMVVQKGEPPSGFAFLRNALHASQIA